MTQHQSPTDPLPGQANLEAPQGVTPQSIQPPIRVFVYGTLKPGEQNYQQYCEGKVVAVEPAIARGKLYGLAVGYPALGRGDEIIHGFVLSFREPDSLAQLDSLEDYHPGVPAPLNLYQREQAAVFRPDGTAFGSAWLYRMELDKITQLGGVHRPDGQWQSALS